ncbi:hypothetical protein BC940DRAFT_303343 [Gongronella butleri]|nr:hypothetical protein BC940DRAFT_303343 [Gongronella butleri]
MKRVAALFFVALYVLALHGVVLGDNSKDSVCVALPGFVDGVAVPVVAETHDNKVFHQQSLDHDLLLTTRSLGVVFRVRLWLAQHWFAWRPAGRLYNQWLHLLRTCYNGGIRACVSLIRMVRVLQHAFYDWYTSPSLEYALWQQKRAGKRENEANWTNNSNHCLLDVLNQTAPLCLDATNTTQLQDHMDAAFEEMSFEDQARTLRAKQPLVFWATLGSTMTRQFVRQCQLQWAHNMHAIYDALDTALAPGLGRTHWLEPICHHQQEITKSGKTSALPAFFSVSPFQGVSSVSSVTPPATLASLRVLLHSYPAYGHCHERDGAVLARHAELMDAVLQHLRKGFDRVQKRLLQAHLGALAQEERDLPEAAVQMYRQLQIYMAAATRHIVDTHLERLLNATADYDAKAMALVHASHRHWAWAQHEAQQRPPSLQPSPPRRGYVPLTPDDRWHQWWHAHRKTSWTSWKVFDWLPSFFFARHANDSKEMDESDETEMNLAKWAKKASFSCRDGDLAHCAAHWIQQDADQQLAPHRAALIEQYAQISRSMDHDLHLVWRVAINQIQGRHRILGRCGTFCAYYYHALLFLWVLLVVLFL